LLAQELRTQLTHAGFKVTLTRSTDAFIELPTRPELAKRRSADLFVSLHFNASDTARNSVQGAEVYCLTPVGASSTNARGEGAGAGAFPGNRHNDLNLFLAYQVQKALTRNLAVEDRGVRRARVDHAADGFARLAAAFLRVEAEVLVPGNIHEHLQPVLLSRIQKPAGRLLIHAQEVRAQLQNLRQIQPRLPRRGKRRALRVGRQRPVGDSLDIEFLFAQPEKFSIHNDAWPGRSRGCHEC